jgi:hypothetical protein
MVDPRVGGMFRLADFHKGRRSQTNFLNSIEVRS